MRPSRGIWQAERFLAVGLGIVVLLAAGCSELELLAGRAGVKTKTTHQTAAPALKGRVQQVPPLDLIGEPYQATVNASIRAGPGTSYIVVGELEAGQTVTVAGKVKGRPWYMISQDGVGSGFVSAKLLTPAPTVTTIADEPAPQDAEPTCRTVRQTVTLADGSTHEADVTACQGPTGWSVK